MVVDSSNSEEQSVETRLSKPDSHIFLKPLMSYILYYCRIALHFVKEHLLSCMSQNRNIPEEEVREDSSTMFSEILSSLETTGDDDKQNMLDSVQNEQVEEMIEKYAETMDCISKSMSESTDNYPNLTRTDNMPAEHGRQTEVQSYSHESQNSLPNLPMESAPAQESVTDPADNEDSLRVYTDFGKKLEEQMRANRLELEAKRQQRIDRNMLTSDASQVMLYVLLRLFQIFVKVIGDNNNGNTDLACSILRDFADNWPEFYETLVRYFELYSDEISKTEDFKLSQEYIDKEKKYVIRIEYFYPADGKKTASVEEKRPQELTENFGQLKLSQKNKTVMETLRLMVTDSIPNPIKNFCILQNALIFFRKFSDHRFLPQQNKFRAIEQAPELKKMEKAALVTDAKTESHSKSDEEETFENHREVPKLEKMRPDTDPKTVSGREDLNTDGKEAFQNYYETCEPTKPGSLFEQFEKELSNSSQPEPSSDDSKYEIVNFMEEEILQMADQISVHSLEQTRKTVTGLQTDRNELEERSSTLCTPLEEDVDTENEGFIEKLEEQKKSHEEELERRRQERTEKQEKLNEELREIRRLQKQKFAMLLQCIQWRYRFQEKEGEWSDWIEHCYRRLIVMVIKQFAAFQEELGVSEKAFRKTSAVSPETVQSEVTNLCGKIETTIHKLSIIFENLAKIYENFEDALFIRILQRSSCDISTKLISVLNCLDAIEYSTEWYQELISKFDHIETSDVPGVTELKRLCKEDNIDGLGNMEFPKWEPRSHVNIEELSSGEEENVMEDKPKNSNDSSNEVPESAEGIPMEFVKTGKGMAHPEDSKTASNSDRTETKDSQQIGQVVCSVPTSVGLDEVEQFTCDKAPKVEIEEFSENEEDIAKDKLKGFHKQITSKKTAPITEIEELLSDEDEAAVEEKSEQDKFQEVNPLKCSCECKKRDVDLEDPSVPNNRTGKCSDQEDIKILMGEILVRVSSSMDDNFENQAKSSTRTTPRKELKMDEMVCEETPDYADKFLKKSQKVYYECQLRRRVYKTSRSIEKSNKMNEKNWNLSSTKKLNSTEIMKKCLVLLYDHLLRQPLTWNRIHPMKITHSARVNNNYPPQLVRVWNEIVKKEKKFLDLQQIIELEKSKNFKLKVD
ncbi:hypothetical protein L5515_006020 [Caenorhabditis briggsae]|uniref:Uncharacterized protein n=2 Tax=Caenorhabditis briggsae TaxID=6238 RepID=A0AAE9EUW3_CAEBR|nr:hypothetical protein L5515_006020 [Caenorhabditis briggsae]